MRIVENRAGVQVSTPTVQVSAGAADEDRVPSLDAAGLLDPSMIPPVTSADISDFDTAAQAALAALLAAKAPLASPTFTGTPAAPTAAGGTNTTQLATTAFVAAAVATLLGTAPGVLDTLGEISDAINDDANLYTTLTALIAAKQAGDADLTAVSGSGLAASWTTYTPTISASSGTFTTVAASGRHMTVGKIVHIQIAIAITTAGTAAGAVIASLPSSTASTFILPGREGAVTGFMLAGVASGSNVSVITYANASTIADGANITISGTYEAA